MLKKSIEFNFSNLTVIIVFALLITFVLTLTPKDNKIVATLTSCIDGDTAKFTIGDEVKTVRFLGINTPETVHPIKGVEPYGKQASDYTCNILKQANFITLELDNNSDKYDKYDRLLAWVFVDNELLQSKLVEGGYAKVAYLYGDYKYNTLLLDKEKGAQIKRVGLWYNE